MKHLVLFGSVALLSATCFAACSDDSDDSPTKPTPGEGGSGGHTGSGGKAGSSVATNAGETDQPMAGSSSGGAGSVEQACSNTDGQCIFRNDTFGDEQLWSDTLRLHEVVGSLSPKAALGLGLKVDSEMVPANVLASADLDDPATTVALLSLNAVVGVRATVEDGEVTRIGITCALCHSTVDDSAAPGIGKRIDGQPNRQLNPGAIIAATPGVGALATSLGITTAKAKTVLNSWGPGRYDARLNQDGESFPVWIPPAYGLADVALETYTGEGPISYWNAYVAVTQMGGQGKFVDEDLGLDIEANPDLVTPKLAALRDYQFSLAVPKPRAADFDAEAAERGDALFEGDAQCATCHAGESHTDAPTLHAADEIGTDTNEARRSKTGKYRTTPLRGLLSHPPYFHDGSAATLEDVVTHYDEQFSLGLDANQQADLVEYLKSL